MKKCKIDRKKLTLDYMEFMKKWLAENAPHYSLGVTNWFAFGKPGSSEWLDGGETIEDCMVLSTVHTVGHFDEANHSDPNNACWEENSQHRDDSIDFKKTIRERNDN